MSSDDSPQNQHGFKMIKQKRCRCVCVCVCECVCVYTKCNWKKENNKMEQLIQYIFGTE